MVVIRLQMFIKYQKMGIDVVFGLWAEELAAGKSQKRIQNGEVLV